MSLVTKKILNWNSVNLRIIVSSGTINKCNKECLEKECVTNLTGTLLFSILQEGREQGAKKWRQDEWIPDRFGKISRRVSLATQTDKMILGCYFVLLMERSLSKHFNCIHCWARLMFPAGVMLKCGQPEGTTKILWQILGRITILELNTSRKKV